MVDKPLGDADRDDGLHRLNRNGLAEDQTGGDVHQTREDKNHAQVKLSHHHDAYDERDEQPEIPQTSGELSPGQ